MKKQTYSFSGLNDWACPFRGKIKRIRKFQEPDNPLRRVGSIIADVLGDYRKRCWFRKVRTDFDWFNQRMTHEIKGVGSASTRSDLWTVLDAVRQSDFLLVDPAAQKPYVEQMVAFDRSFKRYGLEDPDKGKWFRGAFFRVRADVIYSTADNLAIVIDDKATWRTDADPFQLRLGAYVAARLYPRIERIIVLFQYLRFGSRVRAEFDPSDVLDAVPGEINERVARVEDIINRQAFVPDPDAGVCWFCGFVRPPWLDRYNKPHDLGGCPAMTKELVKGQSMVDLCKLPEIDDAATAVQATRLLRTVEVHMDAVRDRLREYVEDNPDARVQAAGVEPRFDSSQRWNVPDLRDFVNWLNRNYGLDSNEIWPMLTTNKTALEASISEEIIAKAIDAGHIEIRPQSKFRLAKL